MAAKFINRMTGTEMWVDESRVEEYKALGFRPATTKVTVKKEEKADEAKPIVQKTTKADSAKKVSRKK